MGKIMSAIPSLRNAEKLAAALKRDTYTVACQKCKKPLWAVKILGIYGTKVKAKKTAFPGVPEYKEYWHKNGKTALRTDCPFCGKDYLSALTSNGHVFAKPYILEWDT